MAPDELSTFSKAGEIRSSSATEHRIDARDQSDLGDGLLQTRNRWLRLPPERVPTEPRLEAPTSDR